MRSYVWLSLALAASPLFAQTFPTNEQMRHYKAMSAPVLSPDGKQVLLQITDATADGGEDASLVDRGGWLDCSAAAYDFARCG